MDLGGPSDAAYLHSDMPKRRRITKSKRTVILVLLLIAVLALLLPPSWTSGLSGLTQVLVPLQDVTVRLTGGGRSDSSTGDGGIVSAQAYQQLSNERAAFEHQVAALTVRVEDLENDVEILTATRLWEVAGRRIGAGGRLLPARVITGDLLSWRSSRLINTGSLQGVRRDQPVLTDKFSVDIGSQDGVRAGLAILLQETLVGFVHDAQPHASRVQLVSDPAIELKVRIGRFEGATLHLVDGGFWMTGSGKGTMTIRDVERRDVDAGVIAVGDVVLASPTMGAVGADLPVAMRVGTVSDIQVDRTNPLLAMLTVQSAVNEKDLSRVFVYDPSYTDTSEGR